jgi:hypothetical protein
VKALGLEPPPMMWIFEWDILTGDSATLDTIYAVSRDRVDEAVGEGERAVRDATRMRDLVAGTDPATWRDPALRQRFADTLDYQVDLFGMLGAYRTTFLRYAQWLDTGSPAALDASRAAADEYRAARDEHVRRYGHDLDLPAYNVTAADIGLALASRDQTMAWLARILLATVVLLLLWGAGFRRLPAPPYALRALWTGATRPWRLGSLDDEPSRVDRVLVWAVPAAVLVLSRAALTSFTAPAHLVPTLGAWLLFALTLRLLVRGDPYPLYAAVGGLALLRTVLLTVALSGRGPGGYWFAFWTEPATRTVYVTVAFAMFLALFVTVHSVLRTAYSRSRRAATGCVLAAAGVPLAVLGGLVALLGLERAMTLWNDQLALLPWGLSRILGITVYLEIPAALPGYAAAFGGLLVVAGAALMFLRRPTRR